MKLSKYLLLFVVSFLLLSSCKITNNIFQGNNTSKTLTVDDLIVKLDDTKLDYQTLKIKYQGKINSSETKLNIAGQIRILHDSIIWANATALLGIEVGRILINSDSVYVQNNLKNTIQVYPVKQFADSFGIQAEISVLENFLLGQFSQIVLDDYEQLESLVQIDSAYFYTSLYENDSSIIHYNSTLNSTNLRVDNLSVIDPEKGNTFYLTYPEYVNVDSVYFPSSVNINIKTSKSSSGFELLYKKIYLDKSFSIPSLAFEKYKIIR